MTAEIHDLVHQDRTLTSKPRLHIALERNVGRLQGLFPEMAAFVTFAMDRNGEWSVGWAVTPDGVVGPRMLCGLAVEGIRETLIVDEAINARIIEE